jgi:general stress protein 26
MIKTSQSGFITSKINELVTAVFHSHSTGVLNLNPTIIKTLKVDDNGYIWFLVDKPLQSITEFEKEIPVALNYYKKGAPFFLNVFGIGRIVTDPEELICAGLDSEISNDVSGNKVLLNVKIEHVNYYETEKFTNKNWLAEASRSLKNLLIPHEDFYYNSGFGNNRHFA